MNLIFVCVWLCAKVPIKKKSSSPDIIILSYVHNQVLNKIPSFNAIVRVIVVYNQTNPRSEGVYHTKQTTVVVILICMSLFGPPER